MEETERNEVEVRGRRYVLAPWTFDEGRAWSFRLGRVLVAGGGGDGIAGMLAAVSVNDWRELTDVVIKNTRLVEIVEGEERLPKLVERKELLRVHKGDLVLLVRKHVEVEFADFFDALQEALGVGGKPATAEGAA